MKNMSRKTRKTLSLIIALAILTTLIAACAKQNPPPPQTIEPAPKRDDIIIAIESEPPTLHPFDHKAVTAGYMNALTYNRLFRLDIDTLAPIPDLCESYQQLSETEWLFKLREGIKYHNGMVMTSEDIKASMEYASTFAAAKDYATFWTAIEIIDGLTVKITTKGPYALTLHNLSSISILPKSLIDGGHNFNTSPIGSGPYQFTAQTLGEKLQFTRFDEYFDKDSAAKIKDMTWRIIPEGSSRTIALETGEIDVIIEVEGNDYRRIADDPGLAIYEVDGTRVNFLTMNTEVYPFDNLNVRKAINAAIDKESVIAVAMSGLGSVAKSITPMQFEGGSEEGCDGYSLELAKQYLAASGLQLEGYSFTCLVFNDAARRAAEVIQDNLLKINLDMKIEQIDYATYLSVVFAGDYEIAVSGYTSSTMYNYLYGLFHSDSISAANMARISDSFIDGHIEQGRGQIDYDQRDQTFREATEYLNQLQPFAPLYKSIVLRAAKSSLGGFKVSAAGAMRFQDCYWID